ncbi:hypothetical protein [Paenarthrobacter aromaticivorans]|uniref:hypothetical protein n=1 Tax=Paenarthrobacter aromaticivorans TaxID=2849150 RepID=UPI003A7FDED8
MLLNVDDYPFHRMIGSPLTEHMLRPLDPRCHTVQFFSALTNSDYRVLGEWMQQYPAVTLRAFSFGDNTIKDLDFLRFFPKLEQFTADALYNSLVSLDGLGYLPEAATYLGIGQTKKKLSLKPLGRFTSLRRLYLEGQTKDINTITELTGLRHLTLRSITLMDLSLLQPLTGLKALELKLGGTTDLDLLPSIGRLEYLEFWLVRGLDDVTPISEVKTLQYLFLQSLKQVTALPDFSKLPGLHSIWLETMKGLTDLTPLLAAPALRKLALVNMNHLQPEDVGVLRDHPGLQELTAGLGSKKKNDAVGKLVPLPRADSLWPRPDYTAVHDRRR